MEPDIYFMPLGGGQRVGASCYYLRLGTANIILDAGTGWDRVAMFEPDIHSLITTPLLQSPGQIHQIYISHAHMDHIGYLPELMGRAYASQVYMTEITALLAEYQLYDRRYLFGRTESENRRLATRYRLDQVTTVSYMQKMDFGVYKVTFLPAGHIPGAMMMLFECGKRKILYTGDYSLEGTSLTDGCIVPDSLAIDTVILCGLHARQSGYIKKSDSLSRTARKVIDLVQPGNPPILCRVPQLSKGIELVNALNEQNSWGIPIYVDQSVMDVAAKMEQLSVPILGSSDRIMGGQVPTEPHIYVTFAHTARKNQIYREIQVDFCLHEDFSEMQKFIRRINPRQTVIVHCAKANLPSDKTIEQVIMTDGGCQTQFLFAEEKELYRL